ncbi:MAG: AraC family transcriptional regulator [Saprospiraceae bacterium]|jgi:TolB-like protein|nr:AraC family transcriptional regulator [Saprospiraceae bacterium]
MSKSRQLAAIMFTDIVGYTALMGQDEQHAFTLLDKNRLIHKPIIEEFNGRFIKELGDGIMASFNTVSDAMNAAVKIQENCFAANDFQLRIGLHHGEVVLENDDIFGDAVNIAARIQSAAAPCSIFISESVFNIISNNKDFKTHFVKEEKLKNVILPMRMYQVLFVGGETIETLNPVIAAIEKSIAVLPFVNMSSDPEQEYFSDGISEEIINMLAQVSELKVIGRTSSFAFKGKNMDLKIIGEQLKVTHILEGSVRKSGNKLRVTAQLISVADGFHLYSDKFDRELDDIFAIQDEISLAILNAVKIKLFGIEKEAVLKRYTDNFEAYQLYLQGRYYYNMYNPQAIQQAIFYLEEAIKIDPGYAIAYSGLSFCYLTLWYWNWLPPEKCLPQCLKTAQEALNLDNTIAETHIAIGRIKLHYELNIAEAAIDYKKAIAINPNSAECHIQLGFCAVLSGHYAEAKHHATLADSLDPYSLMNLYIIAAIYWGTEDHEKCFAYGKRLMDLEPNFVGGASAEMLAYMLLHKYEEAIPKAEILAKFNSDLLNLSFLGYNYGMMGENGKAWEIIEKMKKIEGAELSGHTFFGIVHASIGELDIAFEYFDKGVDGHQGWVLWVRFYLREIPDAMKDPRAWRLFERLGQAYE